MHWMGLEIFDNKSLACLISVSVRENIKRGAVVDALAHDFPPSSL